MTDFTLWQQAPFDAVTGHILSRYHDTHRRQFAELIPLAEKVATVHEGTFPAEVLPLLQHMQAELFSHMMKEEQVLFPMINQGAGRGAAMPIRMMMHEHDQHEAAVSRLLELTGNLQAPEGACGSWQRLYALIRELVDDLNDHIVLENEILFPRVLA
ncbi:MULTISPECIES: hemerythrin domain-containing protein [unclassified Neisseria]|uniref:hemerythrin domain-containing protein n=1 Tax=unclassified Neisseria TaxID=2623750 RepID=UPI002666BED8|nr:MULTISPECIES: hemerythrin domain-containing protein [unclassified Neisseria]MDO1509016.1 hemerythrin domain-containing protein [Neisseria sp. MVDL19-042950]MDO1515275.1 hemerythrin domain-containing protein [Neisseria sp. MVDL18-041461]MDO1562635.1 hemerythrin domain-containing protein [Neisseria sp. MVDL20-010259]